MGIEIWRVVDPEYRERICITRNYALLHAGLKQEQHEQGWPVSHRSAQKIVGGQLEDSVFELLTRLPTMGLEKESKAEE